MIRNSTATITKATTQVIVKDRFSWCRHNEDMISEEYTQPSAVLLLCLQSQRTKYALEVRSGLVLEHWKQHSTQKVCNRFQNLPCVSDESGDGGGLNLDARSHCALKQGMLGWNAPNVQLELTPSPSFMVLRNVGKVTTMAKAYLSLHDRFTMFAASNETFLAPLEDEDPWSAESIELPGSHTTICTCDHNWIEKKTIPKQSDCLNIRN